MAEIKAPSWRVRRRIINITLLWAGGLVTYIVVKGEASSLAENIAAWLLLLMGGVINAYVFGAAWDDKNLMAAMNRKPD